MNSRQRRIGTALPTTTSCFRNEFGVGNRLAFSAVPRDTPSVKLFYTGPVVNTEMLVVMLEKHGIAAVQEFADPSLPDEGDLNREAKVRVPETDYERAYQLFYAPREDEL